MKRVFCCLGFFFYMGGEITYFCLSKIPFGKWHCAKCSAPKAKQLLAVPRR